MARLEWILCNFREHVVCSTVSIDETQRGGIARVALRRFQCTGGSYVFEPPMRRIRGAAAARRQPAERPLPLLFVQHPALAAFYRSVKRGQ